MTGLLALSVAEAQTESRPPEHTGNHPIVLARVEVRGDVREYNLAPHAFLQDSGFNEYLLVFGTEPELRRARWPYRVLDSPAAAPEDYVLAVRLARRSVDFIPGTFSVVLDDGTTLTVRANVGEAEKLTALGLALQRFTRAPMTWQPSPPRAEKHATTQTQARHVPFIEGMLSQVRSNELQWLMRRFTGEEVIYADGQAGIITTRLTTSGSPVARALQFAFERFRTLGMDVSYQPWSLSGYTNRNLVATQPGMIRSNEWILITAHLDDVPTGSRAPGADDNASGTLGVLTAASIFSQYRFDRSIRYVLFTGEEQGLYGSAAHAGLAYTNGDNIVAVINADMIAWDGNSAPVFRAFIRTVNNPGFSNDLAVAITLTNVIHDYGLSASLTPVITASGLTASDHASYWNRGFPAILVSEDYPGDFSPYYHTTGDTVARITWKYYTPAVRAFLGTVAHLAEPVEATTRDVMRLTAGNWQTNSGLGGGAWLGRIQSAPTTPGLDTEDVTWTQAAAPPGISWLRPFTEVGAETLQTDVRPDASEVRFPVQCGVVTSSGLTVTTSNRLQFDFLAAPRPDHIYLARIVTNSQSPLPSTGFLSVTNLRTLVWAGGQIALPNLNAATNATRYASLELVVREVNTNRSACQIQLVTSSNAVVSLRTALQVGATVVDEFESSLELGGTWQTLSTNLSHCNPTLENFETGWQEVTYVIDLRQLPAAQQRFFRMRRTWLPL